MDACKGACCWEGDSGAPLEKEELEYDDIEAIFKENGIFNEESLGVSVTIYGTYLRALAYDIES